MKTFSRSALALVVLAILFSLQSFADDSQPASTPDSSSYSLGFSQGSYLGIDPQDVTAERVSALKLKEERGVEVMMVDEDAPAAKAGIREHDVILQFNNVPVQSVAQLKRLLQETPAGRTVSVGLSRDGQPLTVQVKLTNRASETASFPIHVEVPPVQAFENIPDMDFMETFNTATSCGLVVENLSPQLGNYFGVRSGHGVLVRSVE